MTGPEPTIQFEGIVFGDAVALDDPAETYHEASRLYPSTARAQLPGLALLETDEHARASVARASRRHPHRDGYDLPKSSLPAVPLPDALRRRASLRAAEQRQLRVEALAGILAAAYASHPTPAGPRRPVPSAGALYPLELYAVCPGVPRVPAGLLHYDPFLHRLEVLRPEAALPELAAAFADTEPLETAAVVLVATAVLWRTRFKYGQRGYRFALIEAGHLAQNVLLACAALRLPALPVGGFYDRRLDAVVGCNGIDETSLYVLVVGGEPAPEAA